MTIARSGFISAPANAAKPFVLNVSIIAAMLIAANIAPVSAQSDGYRIIPAASKKSNNATLKGSYTKGKGLTSISAAPVQVNGKRLNKFFGGTKNNAPPGTNRYLITVQRRTGLFSAANYEGAGTVRASLRPGREYRAKAAPLGKKDAKIWIVDAKTGKQVSTTVSIKTTACPKVLQVCN